MITFKDVQKNPFVLEFIDQTEKKLKAIEYTDHGIGHASLVSARARTLAQEIGLGDREQELAAIASFVHDLGNFLSRTFHNYFGAFIFQNLFGKDFSPKELALIMEAIVSHDRDEMEITDWLSAVTILADKSDVRRTRVTITDMNVIKRDIHNRVNFAVKSSRLGINKKSKIITLSLKVDTNFVPIMEYFEIFTERMVYCRKAAEFLGYKFGLVINNFKLL